MPRLLPSRGNRRRHSRPRVQHSRYQWVLQRGYVLVRRRQPQPSRRRAYTSRARLPLRQSLSRPTTDESSLAKIPVDAQESDTQANPTIIPDDTSTVADEPMPPRAYFITITTLQAPGWWGAHHVHIEWEGAANSVDRLLRSQSEDSAVWDPVTKSISFAVIDEDPEEAYIRVFRRFIGGIRRVEFIEEDLEDLLRGGRGPGLL